MPGTRNTKQRAVRQEALREQLSQQGHIQHVIEMVDKIRDEKTHLEQDMVSRYKIAIDTKLKLVNKYLADLKATEITGAGGEPLFEKVVREIVDAEDKDA